MFEGLQKMYLEEYQEIVPMLRIGNLGLVKYKKPDKKKRGITNEMQVIIKDFVDEINKERAGSKYKPVTGKQIAVKLLTVFKTKQELYEFFSECKDYKNRNGSFSKRFWGGFKEKIKYE